MARSRIDIGVIQGKEMLALCGERFVPSVRVGSSGRADEPEWPICDRCKSLVELKDEYHRAREERNRAVREMRRAEKKFRDLRRSPRVPDFAPTHLEEANR